MADMTDQEIVAMGNQFKLTRRDLVEISKAFVTMQRCQDRGMSVDQFAELAESVLKGVRWPAT